MGRLRAASEDDIPRIAELHGKAFGVKANGNLRSLQSHLLDVFCRHPWRAPGLHSLVYEDESRRVIGCLGVVPRRMKMGDRPILAAVTHNFIVEPGRRTTLAAIQLLKGFFAGPQDLSLAEGNDPSKKTWEAAGGRTSPVHSIRWTRPLRPARYAASLLRRHGVPRMVGWALRPLGDLLDFPIRRFPLGPFQRIVPETTEERLDAETLLECVDRFSRKRSLRPSYDVESLRWLLAYLERHEMRGSLQKVAVRAKGELIGWYLYYARAGANAEVVQMAASTPKSAGLVLRHLLHDAYRRGAVAVSGQLEPFWMPALSEQPCFLHRGRGGTWLLMHSRHDCVLRSIQADDAFLTRLEGEWWIGA